MYVAFYLFLAFLFLKKGKQWAHLRKRCPYIMNYSWCDETPFPLGKTKRVPRELALALRGGIDPDGKAFYSNTLDGVTSFCGYCPIIFSLLKCSLVEKLIAKSHLANLGK